MVTAVSSVSNQRVSFMAAWFWKVGEKRNGKADFLEKQSCLVRGWRTDGDLEPPLEPHHLDGHLDHPSSAIKWLWSSHCASVTSYQCALSFFLSSHPALRSVPSVCHDDTISVSHFGFCSRLPALTHFPRYIRGRRRSASSGFVFSNLSPMFFQCNRLLVAAGLFFSPSLLIYSGLQGWDYDVLPVFPQCFSLLGPKCPYLTVLFCVYYWPLNLNKTQIIYTNYS